MRMSRRRSAATVGLTAPLAISRGMPSSEMKVLAFAFILCIPKALQAIPQRGSLQQLSSGGDSLESTLESSFPFPDIQRKQHPAAVLAAPAAAPRLQQPLEEFSKAIQGAVYNTLTPVTRLIAAAPSVYRHQAAILPQYLVPPQSNDGGVSDLINAQQGNYQEAAFCLDKPFGAYQDPGGNQRCFFFCTGFQGLGFTTCCAWNACYQPPVFLFPFGICTTCSSPPPPLPPPPVPIAPPPPRLCPTCVDYFGSCEADVRYATQCGATGGCRYEDTGECQQLSGSSILVPVCNFICLAPSPFLPPSPPPPPVNPFPPLPPSPPPPPPSPPPGAPSACGTCADLGLCQNAPSYPIVCGPSQSCEWQFNQCVFDPQLGVDVPSCSLICNDGPFPPSPPPPAFPDFPPLPPSPFPAPPSPPPGTPPDCATCDGAFGSCENSVDFPLVCSPTQTCSWVFLGCVSNPTTGLRDPVCDITCGSEPPPPPPAALCPTCVEFFGNCESDARYISDCGGTGGCEYQDTGLCQLVPGTGALAPECNFICLAPGTVPPAVPPPPPFNDFPPLPPSPPPPPPGGGTCGTCDTLPYLCQDAPDYTLICTPGSPCTFQFEGCVFDPNIGADVPSCSVVC